MFVHKDITYATYLRVGGWNPQEEACYNYASMEGEALRVYPCRIVAKIDKDTNSYFVQEEPYDKNNVFEMEHSQLYYCKEADDQN